MPPFLSFNGIQIPILVSFEIIPRWIHDGSCSSLCFIWSSSGCLVSWLKVERTGDLEMTKTYCSARPWMRAWGHLREVSLVCEAGAGGDKWHHVEAWELGVTWSSFIFQRQWLWTWWLIMLDNNCARYFPLFFSPSSTSSAAIPDWSSSLLLLV